jgi:hypothetical protein
MTTRLGDRVIKLEQRSSAFTNRYVLHDDEQPIAAEIARGQKFARVPSKLSVAEWMAKYTPRGQT